MPPVHARSFAPSSLSPRDALPRPALGPHTHRLPAPDRLLDALLTGAPGLPPSAQQVTEAGATAVGAGGSGQARLGRVNAASPAPSGEPHPKAQRNQTDSNGEACPASAAIPRKLKLGPVDFAWV